MVSLVHTCTVNGVADGTDEMIVNDIEPSDSSALLELVRKLTAIINNRSLHNHTITQFCSICTCTYFFIC